MVLSGSKSVRFVVVVDQSTSVEGSTEGVDENMVESFSLERTKLGNL